MTDFEASVAQGAKANSEGSGGRSRRGGGRASGGAAARRASRQTSVSRMLPVADRSMPPVEVLSEDQLEHLMDQAENLLQEIGIDIRDEPEGPQLFKAAGADVDGDRVRIPKGLAPQLMSTAPSTFVQHARNPARSVEIGGRKTVFAPVYGPPFVRDLDQGRRYATIQDFENIVKLVYALPALHHSGGTVCEPVDVAVNKRHLDMVRAHLIYSDKPLMGSVTAPERAEDSVEMVKLMFGDEFVDQKLRADQFDQRKLAVGSGRDHDGRHESLRPRQPSIDPVAVHCGRRYVADHHRRHCCPNHG